MHSLPWLEWGTLFTAFFTSLSAPLPVDCSDPQRQVLAAIRGHEPGRSIFYHLLGQERTTWQTTLWKRSRYNSKG